MTGGDVRSFEVLQCGFIKPRATPDGTRTKGHAMNRFFTKSVTVAAVGLSAVTALSALATTPALADHGALPPRVALYPDQEEFLNAVNALRAAPHTCGTKLMPAVAPVSFDLKLAAAAQRHATDMATKNFFSATGSDGSTNTQRLVAAGFTGTASGPITAGRTSVASMATWLADPSNCGSAMQASTSLFGFARADNAASTYKSYWVLLFNIVATPTPPPTIPLPAAVPATTAEQQEFITLINATRSQPRNCGSTAMPAVGPVTLEPRLIAAAQAHAKDMGVNDFFSHTGTGGTTAASRLAATGYKALTVGENITREMMNVPQAIAAWLQSPGHCKNIMEASAVHMGLGKYLNAKRSLYLVVNMWSMSLAKPSVSGQ